MAITKVGSPAQPKASYEEDTCLSQLVAITKYHGLGNLNYRHLFIFVLAFGKPKIKMATDLVHGHTPLARLQIATILLYPHRVERKSSDVSSSLVMEQSLLD